MLLVVTAAERSAGSHCHLLGCSRASRDLVGIKRLTRRMPAAPSAWQGPPHPQNHWGFCAQGAPALRSARWGSPGGSAGAQGDVRRRTAHPLRGSPPARGSSHSTLPTPRSPLRHCGCASISTPCLLPAGPVPSQRLYLGIGNSPLFRLKMKIILCCEKVPEMFPRRQLLVEVGFAPHPAQASLCLGAWWAVSTVASPASCLATFGVGKILSADFIFCKKVLTTYN